MLKLTNKLTRGALWKFLLFGISLPAMSQEQIVRNDEGKFFHSTIEIPANAETLFVSGKGASVTNPKAPKGKQAYGDTITQTRSTFNNIIAAIENAGWSLADIVMVRVYLVADPATGKMDFEGFNKAFLEFFGTEEQPNKPVRAVVEVVKVARPGWLVEIDVRGHRVPAGCRN